MNNYEKLMQKARETNQERDQADKHGGFATPDVTVNLLMRTAMGAIECGIKTEDWNNVAEGQAMLEQLANKLNIKTAG